MSRKVEKREVHLREIHKEPNRYWTRIVISAEDSRPIPNGTGLNYISPDVCGALTINAGTFEYRSGLEKPSVMHSHGHEELHYIISGSGWIGVEDEVHHFDAGDFIFIPAHARHTWGNTGDTTLNVLFYRPIQQLPPGVDLPLDVRRFEVAENKPEIHVTEWKVEGREVRVRETNGEPYRYWTRIVISPEDSRPIPNGNGTNYVSPDVCGSLQINAGTFGHPPGYAKPEALHSHGNEEFSYILKGRGWIQMEDQVHRFKAGDFVFVPAFGRHTWGVEGDEGVEILFYRPIKALPPRHTSPLDIRNYSVELRD